MLLVYLVIGGVLTYFIQSQKIFDYIFFTEFLKVMRKCDICLGYWVFFVLYPLFRVNIFQGIFQYNNFQEVFLAIISSVVLTLLAHYIRVGIRSDHQTIVYQG